MADAATLKDILAKLETIASYADLKTIRLQVQRRERELDAGRATQFQPDAEVCMYSKRGPVFGVVQGTDGANVLVKMTHRFVARLPAVKLSLVSRRPSTQSAHQA